MATILVVGGEPPAEQVVGGGDVVGAVRVGAGDQAVEVVVGGVGDGRRRGRRRAGGGGGGLCRAPALDELAARAVALAGDQPLGASLGGAADRVTVGVVGLVGDLAQGVGGFRLSKSDDLRQKNVGRQLIPKFNSMLSPLALKDRQNGHLGKA